MKIAITLCASLGGLIATVAGLAMLDELARGRHYLPQALCWWLAVAWVPALVGLLLLFEKGGPAAALAFGSCPLGSAILALPDVRIAGLSMVVCGFLTVAAGLSLVTPAAHSEGPIMPQSKPRPLLWLGCAVLLSALMLAGLQVYFAGKADAHEQEAAKIVREIAGIREIVAEVQAYKAKQSRLGREIEILDQAHQSFRKLAALRALDAVESGKDVWIESVEVTEHRFEVVLTTPSLAAAAAFKNRLSAVPGVGKMKIYLRNAAPGPGRQRHVITGDLNESKIPANPGNDGNAEND